MAKSIAKNTAYLYLKVICNIFLSLYSTRIILNVLGTEDFGLWGVIGGVIAFLSFLSPALSTATQRFLSFYEGKGDRELQKRYFSVSIVLHWAMAAFVVVLLEVLGLYIFDGFLTISPERLAAAKFVYHCMVLSLTFTFISVPYDATINAHEDMRYYSFVGIVEAVLKLLAALLLTVPIFADKLEAYAVMNVGITLIVLLTLQVYARLQYKEARFSFQRVDRNTFREMFTFTCWNLTGTFTQIFGNHGLNLLTNHFFGTRINAALSIMNQLGGYLNTFSANLLKAVNPVIVKNAGRDNAAGMLNYTLLSCKMSFLLFAFFALPVLVDTPYILVLWLKQVPEWVVLFVKIHFLRVFLEQLTLPLKTAINAQGRIAALNLWTSASQLLALPMLWLVFSLDFPPYWTIIIGAIFMSGLPGLAQLYYTHRLCGLRYRDYLCQVLLRTIPLTLLTALFLYGLRSLLGLMTLPLFFAMLAVYVPVFCLAVYFLGLSTAERQTLRSALLRLRARIPLFK